MEDVLAITIIGSIVGVIGTGFGGIITLALVRPDRRFLSVLLGITSGLMIAIVTFDLLPEATEIGGLYVQIAGLCIGVIAVILIENLLPDLHNNNYTNQRSKFLKAGILVGIGIAIHNLPEGLAIGSSFAFASDMGIRMVIVITLHNIPEGMAMATPLRIGGYSKIKVFLMTLLSGVPTGIGAFIGAIIGSISDFFIALCLALAGGTMLYITCSELIPNAKALHNGRASTMGIVIGFILGMIIVLK